MQPGPPARPAPAQLRAKERADVDDRPAAVGDQRRAGDERGVVGGQELGARRDLRGRGHAPERQRADGEGDGLGLADAERARERAHLLVAHRRPHPPRAEDVHPYALRAVVVRHRARQPDDRVLAGDVARHLAAAHEAGDRGDDDDGAAAARDQRRQGGAADLHHAADVHPQHLLPRPRVLGGHAAARDHAGVRDHDVEAAAALDGRADRRGAVRRARGVAREREPADRRRDLGERLRAPAGDGDRSFDGAAEADPFPTRLFRASASVPLDSRTTTREAPSAHRLAYESGPTAKYFPFVAKPKGPSDCP